MKPSKLSFRLAQLGAMFALLAVILGAFGAHALKGVLDAYALAVYQTAVNYQMYHGLALLGVAVFGGWAAANSVSRRWLQRSAVAFIFGIVFFCGSLYLLSFTGLKGFGAVTPIGGAGLIGGWIMLIVSLRKMKQELDS